MFSELEEEGTRSGAGKPPVSGPHRAPFTRTIPSRMSTSDDDELDSILDSALDKFDVKTPSETVENASCKPAAGEPSEDLNDASAAEALLAFEKALKPLDPDPTRTGDQEEEDMKLIAEFIKSMEPLIGGAGQGEPAAGTAGGERSTSANAPADIENAIKSLIDNVLSKEILQEPMQQIRESLGNWLLKQGDNLAPSDRKRHENQHALVVDICSEYEKDEEDADSSRVIDLLAKLKETGALPSEVMSELPDDGSDGDAGTGGGIPGLASMLGGPAEMEEMMSNCPVQ